MERNIQLIINGNIIDSKDISNISINLLLKDVQDFNKNKTSFTKPISVLQNKANDVIFKSAFDINASWDKDMSPYMFNPNLKIPGELRQDGFVLISGNIQLTEITNTTYEIVLSNADFDLFQTLGEELIRGNDDKTKDLSFDSTVMQHTPTQDFVRSKINEVLDFTTDDNFVYPFIDYENLKFEEIIRYNTTNLLPAIQIKPVFDKIISDAGYTYEMSTGLTDVIRELFIPYNGGINELCVPETHAQKLHVGKKAVNTKIDDEGYVRDYFFDTNADKNLLLDCVENYSSSKPLTIFGNFTIKPVVTLSLRADINPSKTQDATVYFVTGDRDGNITETELGEIKLTSVFSLYNFNIDDGSTGFTYTYCDIHNLDAVAIKVVTNDNNCYILGYNSYIDFYIQNWLYSGEKVLNINDLLPYNYKKVDLLNDIFKMFNCYVEVDKLNSKNLLIKTYSEYFGAGKVLDWSEKVDDTQVSIQQNNAYMDKVYNFKFAEGKDAYNQDYITQFGDGFGNYKSVSENEFVTTENTKQLSCAATVFKSFDFPLFEFKIPIITNNQGFNSNWEPRILFYNQFEIGFYYWTWGTDQFYGSFEELNYFPTLSDKRYGKYTEYDNDENLVLNFNAAKTYAIVYEDIQGVIHPNVSNRTLYNLYHKEDIERLLDVNTKLLKIKAVLSTNDISNLSLADKVFISSEKFGDAYYRINSIKNFSGDNKLCDLELIKLNYYRNEFDNYLIPEFVNYSGPTPSEASGSSTGSSTGGGVTPSVEAKIIIYNVSGEIIPIGSVVIPVDYNYGCLNVVLAQANDDDNIKGTLLVATGDIPVDEFGHGISFGKFFYGDTSEIPGTGDLLYLSSTVPGQITTIVPDDSRYIVKIGYILNSGDIFVDINTTNTVDNLIAIADLYTGCTDTHIPFYNSASKHLKDSPFTVVNGKVGLNKPTPIYDLDISGITKTDSLILNNDISTGLTHEIGELYYDKIHSTVSVKLNNEVTLQIGEETVVQVYNNTAAVIPNGKLCYVTGSYQDMITTALANAAVDIKSNVIGFTTQTIGVGESGFITVRGLIHDINTSGFTIGDMLYLSDTVDGGFTNNVNDISLSSRTCKVGVVVKIDSTQGIIFSNINCENISTSLTIKEQNLATGNINSTGCYYNEGITCVIGGTTFNIGVVKGWIVKNTGINVNTPTVVHVNYNGGTNIPITYLSSSNATYLLINESGNLIQQINFPSAEERRNNIFLGTISHINAVITVILNKPDFIQSPTSQLRDMFSPIPFINDGVNISPNGVNLNFNTSAGILYGLGINYIDNPISPDSLNISAQIHAVFQYRTQTTGDTTNISLIDPNHYDLNGVITPIPLSGQKFRGTNQRVFLLVTGELRIQYGQTIYYAENDQSLADVVLNAAIEEFILYPPLKSNGILIGIISLACGATDLSNTAQARFLRVSKFGDSANSAGGQSITDLQEAYDNSVNPEIITNSTLGAVSFKNGINDNNANVIEVQSYENGNTFSVNGSGRTTTNNLTISNISENTGLTKVVVVDNNGNTFYKVSSTHQPVTLGYESDPALILDEENQILTLDLSNYFTGSTIDKFIYLTDTFNTWPNNHGQMLKVGNSAVEYSTKIGSDATGPWIYVTESHEVTSDNRDVDEMGDWQDYGQTGWTCGSETFTHNTGNTNLLYSPTLHLKYSEDNYDQTHYVLYVVKESLDPINIYLNGALIRVIDGEDGGYICPFTVPVDGDYVISFEVSSTDAVTIFAPHIDYYYYTDVYTYTGGLRIVDNTYTSQLNYPNHAGKIGDVCVMDDDGLTMTFKSGIDANLITREQLSGLTGGQLLKYYPSTNTFLEVQDNSYKWDKAILKDSFSGGTTGFMYQDSYDNYRIVDLSGFTGDYLSKDDFGDGLMKISGDTTSTIPDNSDHWNTLDTLGQKKFWQGTAAQYAAIGTKDANTIYFINV